GPAAWRPRASRAPCGCGHASSDISHIVADPPAQELAVERLAIEAEHLRRVGPVAVARPEHAEHVAALELLEREQLGALGARERRRAARGGRPELVGQDRHRGVRADGPDPELLDRAQELRLQDEPQLAEPIEEQRAAARLLEHALAALVAEQLALEQR